MLASPGAPNPSSQRRKRPSFSAGRAAFPGVTPSSAFQPGGGGASQKLLSRVSGGDPRLARPSPRAGLAPATASQPLALGRGGRGGRAPSGRQEVNGKRRLLPPTPQCRSRLLQQQQQRVTSARLSRAAPRRAACRPQGCRRGGRRQLAAPRLAAGCGALPAGPPPGCGDIGRRLVRGRRRRAGAPVPAASASRNSLALPGAAGGLGSGCPARLPGRSALRSPSPARCWRLRTINSSSPAAERHPHAPEESAAPVAPPGGRAAASR